MMSDRLFCLTLVSIICFLEIFGDPINYDGTSDVTLNKVDEWSAKYAVGPNCGGDSTIELTIDITKTSSEADLILGFGTETAYFAIFNPYDGAMCVPCSGNVQSGTLFVTPPRNTPLRTPDAGKTTTTQYGATTNALGARVALVNSQDQTAQWDQVIGSGSNIGKNVSPIKLTIVQDVSAGETTLTVQKNGVTASNIKFTSTFGANENLFLFLGIDDANTESFLLKQITKTSQCNPSGLIDYDGSSQVVLDQKGEWSARYAVSESCPGRGLIELDINVKATSSEADLILGFGTESEYFVVFNSYDGGMCIPCSGSTQSGTLFVTPPQGQALRDADTTTTAQFGATTDTVNRARAALINQNVATNAELVAQWDKVVGTGSNIGKNSSPIKLRIATSAGKTIVTVTKNGVTSPNIQFTSTFPGNQQLYLFLGIDDWNTESFILNGITQQTKCEQCDSCENRDRIDALEKGLSKLGDAVDSNKKDCDAKVDAVNKRVDAVNIAITTTNGKVKTVDGKVDAVDARVNAVNDRIDKLIKQLNGISAAESSVFSQKEINDDGNVTYLLSNTDLLIVSLLLLNAFIIIFSICSCWRNGYFGGNKRAKHKYSRVNSYANSDVENLK